MSWDTSSRVREYRAWGRDSANRRSPKLFNSRGSVASQKSLFSCDDMVVRSGHSFNSILRKKYLLLREGSARLASMNENKTREREMLCLASHSPRRRSLLEHLKVPFFVRAATADTEETVPSLGRGMEAEQVALERARVKGEAVRRELAAEGRGDCSILSADTVVHLGPELLDKPSHPEQAMDFLRLLSGRRHGVVTALWMWHRGREETRWARTWVKFAPLQESVMRAYVDSEEPFDKAGGYGIQGVGGALVEGVEGCYFNVMGLPVHETAKLFSELGIPWALNRSAP